MSLNDILISEKNDEDTDNTDDIWSNNSKVFTVLKLKLRNTAESSALCRVLKWNQLILLSDLYDSDDDAYKDMIIFCYILSEKSLWIHHSHNDEVKLHKKKSNVILYWIDMIEND